MKYSSCFVSFFDRGFLRIGVVIRNYQITLTCSYIKILGRVFVNNFHGKKEPETWPHMLLLFTM